MYQKLKDDLLDVIERNKKHNSITPALEDIYVHYQKMKLLNDELFSLRFTFVDAMINEHITTDQHSKLTDIFYDYLEDCSARLAALINIKHETAA